MLFSRQPMWDLIQQHALEVNADEPLQSQSNDPRPTVERLSFILRQCIPPTLENGKSTITHYMKVRINLSKISLHIIKIKVFRFSKNLWPNLTVSVACFTPRRQSR